MSPSFDISLWTPNVPSQSCRLSVATMRHFCSLVVQTQTQPNHCIGLHITPGNADLPSGCSQPLQVLVFVVGRCVMEAGRMIIMASHNERCWQQLTIPVGTPCQYTQVW